MGQRSIPNVNMLVAGEQGLVADFGNVISEDVNMFVQQLARLLTAQQIAGITEVVPTYRSVMVYFDPVLISRSDLKKTIYCFLDQIVTKSSEQNPRKVISVPVCYGGVFWSRYGFRRSPHRSVDTRSHRNSYIQVLFNLYVRLYTSLSLLRRIT